MDAKASPASDEVSDDRGVEVDEEDEGEAVESRHGGERALRFDPHRRARSAGLSARIDYFRRFLTDRESEVGFRKRSRTSPEEHAFRTAVEALSCNLLAASLIGPEIQIAVPRDNSAVAGPAARESVVYGRHFLALLNLLVDERLGLIEQELGRPGAKGKAGVRTKIRATPKLADHLPLGEIAWSDLTQEQTGEVLVLKAAKEAGRKSAPSVDFKETARTRQMRREIVRLNQRLAVADVTVLKDGNRWPADPTARRLRRIFNNGSWMEGGRLFGGFWMNMRRADRFAFIRIEGEEVADVDYSQLFPHLAYARALVGPPEGDLYASLGHPESRKGWKKIFNAMLFAQKRLTAWPDGASGLMPPGMKPRDAYAHVEAVHAPIASLFWTGIGYRLMFAESTMLVGVLDHLARMDIVALPIHDAVIVKRSRAEDAQGVLQAMAGKAVGLTKPLVKLEYA